MTKTNFKVILDSLYFVLIVLANGIVSLITTTGYLWFVSNFLMTKIECDFREGILITAIFSAWLFLGIFSGLAVFFEAIRLMSEETTEEFWGRTFDKL